MTQESDNADLSWKTFQNTKNFGSLNGLRGISILAVMMHHIDWSTSAPIAERGQLGVRLFFAISGFLITTLLLREKARNGRVSLKAFFMRRALRIFPLYYAVIAVYCVLVAAIERDSAAGQEFWQNLPYYLSYTSNWFVKYEESSRTIFYFAWSLATEEQFYLTFPWIVALFSMRGTVLALFSLLAITFANHLNLLGLEESLTRSILWNISPSIVFGALFAHALHRPKAFLVVHSILGRKWSSTACLAFVLVLASLPKAGMPLEHLVYLALTALTISCVIREDHALAKPLKNPALQRLGVVSYGVYLLHMLCFNAADRLGHALGLTGTAPRLVFGILIAWIAAEVSFRTFEAYFLKLKSRFAV